MAGQKFSAEAKQRRAIARDTVPLADRFWAKVNKSAPGGCWEWTAAKRKGHGTIHIGMLGRRSVVDYTHRVVFGLLGIEIPVGMEVDHVCRNRACCNPDHLRFVTSGQNATENNLSPFAVNARKARCVRGHEFTGRDKSGHRYCATCMEIRARERREAV